MSKFTFLMERQAGKNGINAWNFRNLEYEIKRMKIAYPANDAF